MKGKKHNGEHHGSRHEGDHGKEHHAKRAKGGKVDGDGEDVKDTSPSEVYEGKGSKVEKEAKERKHGGKVKRKSGGKVEGEHTKARLDRPARKSGGRVGADRSPMSSAARTTERPGGKVDREDD